MCYLNNELLRIYTNSLATNDWDQLLPVLELTINNTYNATLRETPFYALFEYDSPTVTLNQPNTDYSESDLSIRLKRITQIRKHCRKNLLKIQDKYTEKINVQRMTKNMG